MHNLFTAPAYEGIVARLHTVTPADERQWGKMNVARMLEHCARPFDVTLGRVVIKRSLLGYILGPFFKKSYYDDSEFKHNSPTASEFVIAADTDFEAAKARLLANLAAFYAGGPEKCVAEYHAFFGKLTPEQWAIGMYKHLDHHLRQFGR